MDRRELITLLGASPLVGGLSRTIGAALPESRGTSFDPWVEVHPGHLRHNVAEIRRRTGVPILGVVKNNAYGLGIDLAGPILARTEGISGLAVVKLQEALALRAAGVTAPVLLMGPFEEAELQEAVAHGITPMVYTPVGGLLDRLAARRQAPVGIQVCVDTGIGRVGVPVPEAEPLIRDLAARRSLRIDGIMMTFSEDPGLDAAQLQRFLGLTDRMRGAGVGLGPRHAASSFNLFGDPARFLDQVRPGMALYGVYSELPFRELGLLDLRPAVALRCRVIYVKRLETGQSAGYSRAFVAQEPTWVVTLPLGHVDGIPRVAVKGAKVRIGARSFPIVAISASHAIVALGAEPSARIGDVATFFDWEGGSRPEDIAAACGASVYDLLMHLGQGMPRRVVA